MDDGAFRRTCSMSYAQTEPVEERGTGWSRRLLQSKWEACTCPFSARSRCSCIAAACRRRFASSTSHGSGNGSAAPDEAPTGILCSPLPNPQARKKLQRPLRRSGVPDRCRRGGRSWAYVGRLLPAFPALSLPFPVFDTWASAAELCGTGGLFSVGLALCRFPAVWYPQTAAS
jgi:hypothetical protein